MDRWRTLAIKCGYGLLGTIGFAALVLAMLLYTAPGHYALAHLIAPLTGGTVKVRGLSGDLPDSLHADLVEIGDVQGVWLRIENVSLDWSALAVLGNHFEIHRVTAAKLVLLRMPVQENSNTTTPQIDIGSLAVARIEIAKSLMGREAVLTAQGSLHYLSRHQLSADLSIVEIGGSDRYRAKGSIDRDVANGSIRIREGAGGTLAGLFGLPGLGAIDLELQAGGDRTANTVAITLAAGALRSSGRGTISLAERRADIDFSAKAPAMQPREDVSWQSLTLDGHMHGVFDAPDLSGTLQIEDAKIAGVQVAQLAADVSGSGGQLDVKGTATGLRLPGSNPDLFTKTPLVVTAHANLDAAPAITFAISHPLLSASGQLNIENETSLAAVVTIPSLAPFAALQNADLRGSATLKIDADQSGQQTRLALEGHIRAEGSSLIGQLLGRNATLTAKATSDGADLTSSSVTLRGEGVNASARGSLRKDTLNYNFALALSDLSQLANTLDGQLNISGSATGPLNKAILQASGSAQLASTGFGRQSIAISFLASDLPEMTSARIVMEGRFDDAPLSMKGDLSLASDGKSRRASLTAGWRSLDARANMTIPQAGPATGRANFELKNLSDLASLLGTAVSGSAKASIEIAAGGAKSRATVHAHASGLHITSAKIASIAADGTIGDLFADPSLALAIEVQNIETAQLSGKVTARLDGTLERLGVVLDTNLRDTSGNPAHLMATAVLDASKRSLRLEQFDGAWRGLTAALKQPAAINFANGVAVDHLVAGVAGGDIDISGRLTPKLAATMSAHDISASALQPLFPQLPASGILSATAQLTGTLGAPLGTVTVQGRRLSAQGVSAKAVAPANLDARGVLHTKSVTLDASLIAGESAHLTLSGELPLTADGAMSLHAVGTADLALLNPILTANGRQVRGQLTLDANIAGTYSAPRVTGGGKLSGGEVLDYARGVRIDAIDAAIEAKGNAIHIMQLSARAGPGTITASGTIDLATPGLPVDISIQAKNARPIVSDRMTAVLSGNVKLSGKLYGTLALSGAIDVLRGEIDIPNDFPPEVATLNIRRRGEPLPPFQSGGIVMLDVTASTSGQVFVRGHGIDAEVAGRIHLSGTSGAPLVTDGFDMKRGTLAIAGQTLVFTSGRVSFDGTGVRNRLDPTLNFVAQTTSGGVTATLTISGYASAPKIALSSSPQLPQDEVLAHLLFRQSAKQLTPLQLGEIAQGLASLGGIGSGFNPLGTVRKFLGLDQLAVGSTSGTAGGKSQTTVEAGKYLLRNVYVGGKQNLSGGTQVQVQVDIAHGLKAQATLNTGADATATTGNAAQDNGSSVGLSYQFEY